MKPSFWYVMAGFFAAFAISAVLWGFGWLGVISPAIFAVLSVYYGRLTASTGTR